MKSLMKLFKELFNNISYKESSRNKRKGLPEQKIKVVVVGNCQARPLAEVLENLNPAIEVTAIAIVHLLKSEQFTEYQEAFKEADLIISQLVLDTYPCEFVRTNFLKSTYGDRVISIVNLYYTGYTPDWFYIRIPNVGPLRGPMGDYHNRTIFESWQDNEKVSVAAERLRSRKYNKKYLPEIENSLQILREREKLVDVLITDLIQEKFKNKRLFFTFNHPTMFLLAEYASRVLIKYGIEITRELCSLDVKERLNQFIPLINPAVDLPSGAFEDKHVGVDFNIEEKNLVTITIGKKKCYDTNEIVGHFYAIYNQLGDQLALRDFGK